MPCRAGTVARLGAAASTHQAERSSTNQAHRNMAENSPARLVGNRDQSGKLFSSPKKGIGDYDSGGGFSGLDSRRNWNFFGVFFPEGIQGFDSVQGFDSSVPVVSVPGGAELGRETSGCISDSRVFKWMMDDFGFKGFQMDDG
ncbi:hypothetical protein U1Q18_019676 [Sarracenia purpurea var. burkii]